MRTLALVCGPAGIGKSTYSETYRKDHPEEDVFVLSADDTRKDMYGGYDKFPPNYNMMPVYREMVKRGKALFESHENLTLIIDTTMLYDERRVYFVRHLPKFDSTVLVLLKLHDYKKCLERNHQRPQEKWVPENIIISMSEHYEDPSPDCRRHFDRVEEVYVD